MSAYTLAQKSRYRITLDIEAFSDFDPHNIDWTKLFDLQSSENCDAYIENLSDDIWWFFILITNHYNISVIIIN